ncbi:MAG TPA: 3-deoxy-manno-octulosonate cytidylyltransferase [Bacteroidales bacterium]|nr:3-deoxy-manno-octulosonate cytidylyltransferase [Bacteroidales bacterium]HPT01362.1 3-deoxy-manno-octulosonate cytidylyltransferase [Bacteroidales bacterium]
MKVLGVIPARYASTRFPGKPLTMIAGKSMINRVYEQCTQCRLLNEVAVATDDQRIADHVKEFGGNVFLTSDKHRSGTERIGEVLQILKDENPSDHFDLVVNIQGDEPLISPDQIVKTIGCFKDSNAEIATLIKPISDSKELFNPNVVKVVINKNGNALYFSRQPIPFLRGVEPAEWLQHHGYFKHIGIYAFKTQILELIVRLTGSPLEKAESLEQLRWIENGFSINTAITDFESVAIDTPEDLSKLTNIL